MNAVIFDSVSEIARRIRDREISAVEVIEMHLARIDEVNPSLNAVVTRCDDMALERAKEADAALANGRTVGPLHGVPLTIKDAFDTVGVESDLALLKWMVGFTLG
jgi:Asp-tRNA(Asn)/Glu-tRNA(Gln) amidotransferase A subunit family amidase